MNEQLIQAAELLAAVNAQIKELTKQSDELKAILKDNLGDGCHVLGGAVIDLRTQDTSRLNKEECCKFFGCTVEDLAPFTTVTQSRVLTVKAVSNAAAATKTKVA